MANFVSTQTGNLNDGATWGNSSPGVKGTDWPGNAGDTFTASAGHTVTYNVSETNELGQIDLNGKLSFSDAASRKLTLGHEDLNVNNGGELEIGTSVSNFDKTYKAEVLWNTTSDSTKGLIIANGGKLTVYGDSTYCSDYEDTLANDAENTDGDVRIKTVTDMSAIWHVGDELTIKVKDTGTSVSYRDAIKKTIIQSFEAGNVIVLDINITAVAGVGNTWVSPVVNVTRNVQFGKFNADTACGDGSTHHNINRPRLADANVSGNNNCFFSFAMATGFSRIDSDYDFQFLNSTIRNGFYGFYQGTGHTVSGNVYSNRQGFYQGTGHTVSGNVYSNIEGFTAGTGHTVSGNVYSNQHGVTDGIGHTVSGNVYSNYYGFSYGKGHIISSNVYSNYNGFGFDTGYIISGRIGYDGSDVSKPNVADFYTDGYSKHTLLNVKLPLAELNIRRNIDKYVVRVYCEHHNRVAHAHKIYDNNGDVIKTACDGSGDAPSQDPDGGSGNCIELSNVQTICDTNNPLIAIETGKYRIWATTATKTYTFKVQTTYAGITAGNLKLTAKYLDEASGGHLGEQINAPAINQRATAADWTQILAVTVTPSQVGWVDFEIKLMEYEAGNEVYIWPVTVIT